MMRTRARTSLNMRAVALHAGVSSATVSRVINGSAYVSEDVAERVRKALDELKFIPNPIATTLKYGRSKTYGVIVPDLSNPFYPEFLLQFEDVLVEIDHELLLASTQSSQTKLISSVRRMLMRRVDGVVLMASELDTRSVEPLLEHKIPIVTVDRRRAQEGTGDVAIDFEDGYLKAVPVDPFTQSKDTWVTDSNGALYSVDQTEAGIDDVHSGSQELSAGGEAYSTW